MIQCKDCEFFQQDESGRRTFRCDPFMNIKEPECLMKWQLLRLDLLITHYHSMLKWQEKVGPIQDKILKYVKREIDDIEDSDKWKYEDEDGTPKGDDFS